MIKHFLNSFIINILLFVGATAQNNQSVYNITDKETFFSHDASLLIFHNNYYAGKNSGIQLIQHGDLLLSDGDIYSTPIPIPDLNEELLPKYINRNVNKKNDEIISTHEYPAYQIKYSIHIKAEGKSFRITVDLEKPIDEKYKNKLWFALDIYPEIYRNKGFLMDNQSGIFSHQVNGPRYFTDSIQHSNNNAEKLKYINQGILGDANLIYPQALAKGHNLSIAPEDPEHFVMIESSANLLELYDGRNSTDQKWFVVKSLIPLNVSKKAIEWVITPNHIKDWKRNPKIGYSQVGYHPQGPKKAIIEFDDTEKDFKKLSLLKIMMNGVQQDVKTITPVVFGKYLRYNYSSYDFSEIKEEGLYILKYGNVQTDAFRIDRNIYSTDIWQPTLETFFPVQMCHMTVFDRIRLWHRECHLDDALQAPVDEKIKNFKVKSKSNTTYNTDDHISGLNTGGWHDAGDYQLATSTVAATVYYLSLTEQTFNVNSDQTTVDQQHRRVLLHVPDGKNDLLQQIEHGLFNLVNNYKVLGFCPEVIINNSWVTNLYNGDPSNNTDNKIYSSNLSVDSIKDNFSGVKDDRYVITNVKVNLQMEVASALAIAYKSIVQYNPKLAEDCKKIAEEIWRKQIKIKEDTTGQHPFFKRHGKSSQLNAACELYILTGDSVYRNYILLNSKLNDASFDFSCAQLCRAVPLIKSKQLDKNFNEAIYKFKKRFDSICSISPYHVAPVLHMFGTMAYNLSMATNMYMIHKYNNEIPVDYLFNVMDYAFGNHPDPGTALISGVGTKSITSAFGINRYENSYVPGGVTCGGPSLIYPELNIFREHESYFWLETEYTINAAANYLFCVLAMDELLNKK